MKILYLMHVDWNWIKQRPHFIAEKLAENNNEIVIRYIGISRKGRKTLVNNYTSINDIKPILRLRGVNYSLIFKLNNIIYYFYLKFLLKNKYDYVYVTHPSLSSKALKNNIIYDCMDDHISFKISAFQKKDILKKEKILLNKAVCVFSSDYLAKAVMNRYGVQPKKYEIINNAISLPPTPIRGKIINKKDENLVLTYIGTVASWFDFKTLKQVQELYSKRNLIFNIYGPVESNNNYKGFNFLGSIEHNKIFEIMEESDILIMPFIVDELIKSVNPVKLYEYIYSGKPIISVKYGETEKFNDYVFLYEPQDSSSFIEQIDKILNNGLVGKEPLQKCKVFVQMNTWDKRAEQLIRLLGKNN